MLDMNDLQNLGARIDPAHPAFPEIWDHTVTSPDREHVAEVGTRSYGNMVPLTPALRERFDIGEEGSHILAWSDGNPEEPEDGLRVIDQAAHDTLAAKSASTIIERVRAHYERLGTDDGHPAYAFISRRA